MDSMDIPAVFYVSFVVDANVRPKRKRKIGFIISPEGALELPRNDRRSLIKNLKVKDFGIIETISSSDDRVRGIGYTSYGFPEERIEEMMGVWRQAFVKVCGESAVSLIVEVDVQPGELWNAFEIYEAILLKVEGVS